MHPSAEAQNAPPYVFCLHGVIINLGENFTVPYLYTGKHIVVEFGLHLNDDCAMKTAVVIKRFLIVQCFHKL
jgi:hypothetical protein